jgi:hypothetical protein
MFPTLNPGTRTHPLGESLKSVKLTLYIAENELNTLSPDISLKKGPYLWILPGSLKENSPLKFLV